ncbi:MAG: hypothetical protein PHC61_06095 [Chitinivibrionales bacterium]|nr:hypothetical protein [Chitinivibrionales bacterium]
MCKIKPVIMFVLVAFFMTLTTEGGARFSCLEDRAETSSENHRECFPDESEGLISPAAQSGVTVRIRNAICIPHALFKKMLFPSATLADKLYAVKVLPDFLQLALETKVLRI